MTQLVRLGAGVESQEEERWRDCLSLLFTWLPSTITGVVWARPGPHLLYRVFNPMTGLHQLTSRGSLTITTLSSLLLPRNLHSLIHSDAAVKHKPGARSRAWCCGQSPWLQFLAIPGTWFCWSQSYLGYFLTVALSQEKHRDLTSKPRDLQRRDSTNPWDIKVGGLVFNIWSPGRDRAEMSLLKNGVISMNQSKNAVISTFSIITLGRKIYFSSQNTPPSWASSSYFISGCACPLPRRQGSARPCAPMGFLWQLQLRLWIAPVP